MHLFKHFCLLFFTFSFFSLKAIPFGFKDPEYSFQTLRTISGTAVGYADIGECLLTIQKIQEGNDDHWFLHWNQLAERVEQEAIRSSQNHHLQSASAEFSRASNYYRTAEFFLHHRPLDTRITATWAKSRDCFREAIKNASYPVREVKIPFEGTTLPGYLCLVDSEKKARPLLIAQTGFDGTAEELYFTVGKAAIARGYNCLIFEGPGQGEVIRIQGIPFRPNWETVITPVVNFAVELPEVDQKRMALLGISMGGFLVPRALAYEHRLKLGIANGGIYDFHEVCMSGAPKETEEQLDDPKEAKELDEYLYRLTKASPSLRRIIGNGMYTFKAASPVEWLKLTRAYTMRGYAPYIRTKMLIVHSENDTVMKGQAKRLYDALRSPKDFMIFSSEEGAGAHCQAGAYCLSNEQIFNWLDENL